MLSFFAKGRVTIVKEPIRIARFTVFYLTVEHTHIMKKRLSGFFTKLTVGSQPTNPTAAEETVTFSSSKPPSAAVAAAVDHEKIFTSPPIESNPANLWLALELKEDDVEVLYFLFLCKCKSLLDITTEEFIQGKLALGAKSLQDLKLKLKSSCQDMFKNEDKYKSFFAYCFQASREGTIKTVAKDTVVFLLPICMSSSPYFTRAQDFCKYLESTPAIKHVRNDEWMSFLKFCRTVPPNLDNYSSEESWPLLIDDYVDWSLKQ